MHGYKQHRKEGYTNELNSLTLTNCSTSKTQATMDFHATSMN
jgi:hypothetical protein